MKFNLTVALLLLLIAETTSAQNARFTTQGVITFEKRVNMYALIKDQIQKNPDASFYKLAFEDYQKKQPQFKVLKSTLAFSKDQSLFKPIDDEIVANNNFFSDFNVAQQNNIIATNTLAGTSTTQKAVYEETYLVKDSTRKINWKITNEIRNIAGYDCRRANALIMDSIYVVAFYTDEIPVSGGPETFTGLPGMILGLALPYEHVTWFATSVVDQPVTEDKLRAPTKGKPVNNAQLIETLRKALKSWGNYAQDALKAFLM